jgi:DNA helicase-2/ATP-dependent DNA helicase PcrA
LANDDILATLSLAKDCYQIGRETVGRQLEFVSRHQRTAEKLRSVYGRLYCDDRASLYREVSLAKMMEDTYHRLREMGVLAEEPKLLYVIRYVEQELMTAESGHLLAEQLHRHIQDLSTMKEADLCGSSVINERVFVSAVHKAKGLEFDSVIVFDAVEGKYPSIYANTRNGGDQEEARKFYVAISRARRRLIVTYCRNSVNRWGRWFAKQLTPYMDCIRSRFL